MRLSLTQALRLQDRVGLDSCAAEGTNHAARMARGPVIKVASA